MQFDQFVRGLGQALGAAMAEGGKFSFDTSKDPGVALADLDLEGAKPDALKVALSRSDTVFVTVGKKLAISVEAKEAGEDGEDGLRFRLEGDKLAIFRRRASPGGAVISVTMPAPRSISIGGAGTVESETLASDAKLSIGGTGTIRVSHVAGGTLKAKIGGVGRIEAAGKVETFKLSIGGSGKFTSPELEAEHAEIRFGGAGKAEFASEGTVEVSIGGVGEVVVHGTPQCAMKSSGAGKLRCVPREAKTPVTVDA